MNRADRKEYMKAYMKAYREANKDEYRAYQRAYQKAHKDEYRAQKNSYRESHKDEYRAYQKAYRKDDKNSNGVTKNCIRTKSRNYLFKVLKHTKINGYEIHHCFGYDDYKKFIYIPRGLHLQIHQFLRDNGIDADSNHYRQIEHIIENYFKHNNKHFLVL